jgi:hypothetical protein
MYIYIYIYIYIKYIHVYAYLRDRYEAPREKEHSLLHKNNI